MGPVPFAYSAEAFPMHVRDVGMSWATATTWCFNFIISFTFPALRTAFTSQGAFGWYAGWCIILWILVILFLPETKGRFFPKDKGNKMGSYFNHADFSDIELTLEELDQVFSVPTWKHTSYEIKSCVWHVRRYIFFQKDMEPLPPLFYRGTEKEKMSQS
ncbi:MAG: hypothetical protein Q9194_004763 [Teloschistes cf. exilis]